MFDIGWSELLIIGIVALIVVGPKDLPMMFRRAGQFVGRVRAMASEFTRAMDEAADSAGVNELSAGVNELKESIREVTSFEGTGLDEVSSTMRDYSDKINNLNPVTQAKKIVTGEGSEEKGPKKKPAAKKPAEKKPAAKKPAAKKTAAKKPAAKKTAKKAT